MFFGICFILLVASQCDASLDGKFKNMNGDYLMSKTPGAPLNKDFPTHFEDFPGGVEYFEVYHGPIKTVYSQVNWHPIQNDIPADIVKRFDGKAMAIVGIEMDQVRRTPQGDIPVPISMAYNHHHDTAVIGKGTHLEKVSMDDPRVHYLKGHEYIMLSGHKVWLPIVDTPSVEGLPTSAMFSDGNGGEYRKSFHAYAPPFAQIVESPTTFAGSAMQIDTWNRDKMNITGGPFVPGPVPRSSLAPKSGKDAIYSGILECPITTRIQKIYNPGSEGFNDSFVAQVTPCAHTITNEDSCFAAGKALPGLGHATITTQTVHDADTPPGCTVAVSIDGSKAQFTFNLESESKSSCSDGPDEIAGATASLIDLQLSLSGEKASVTITMTGPSTAWFGVGFGATLMSELPYVVTVDGSGKVVERKLADHAAGTVLASSVTVVSNSVAGGKRTVVVSRPLKGASKDHYTFSAIALSIPIINAVGTGPVYAYHKASKADSVNLWPSSSQGSSACVCVQPALPFGQGSGLLKYIETGETVGFPAGRCSAPQNEDLRFQGNPSCDIRTYVGGLNACHDGWKLLDADQEIPWADQPIEYYKKYRVYFQDYKPGFHMEIQRQDWGIACDGDHSEYDVPQCAPGTPTAECKHTISGAWIPIPASKKDVYLVAAHHHCHAPTCLRVELWNNDTGKILCAQEPVYGGTHKIDLPAYDEPGYIATPPCLWGYPEHGLEAPPLVSGMKIRVVAITNSTYGHHGEMALPEIALVQGPLPPYSPSAMRDLRPVYV